MIRIMLLAVCLACASSALQAQEPPTADAEALPSRGMSMAAVLSRYGEPELRHSAVGGGAPQQPLIVRWDYPGFSVFFERDRVIDTVRPDAPAPVAHQELLQPTP